MCLLKLIIFSVLLSLVFLTISTDSLTIEIRETTENNSQLEAAKFEITEDDYLNIKLQNLSKKLDAQNRNCGAKCYVNNSLPHELNCTPVFIGENIPFLNISALHQIKKNDKGTWTCTINIHCVKQECPQSKQDTITAIFELDVKSKINEYPTATDDPEKFFISKMTKTITIGVGAGIALLLLLIIIIQTCCIVHYRRKAAAVQCEVQWPNKICEDAENTSRTVRYSEMPGLKKKEVLIPESRESGIYEALENIRAAPEPPPLESLPMKNPVPMPPLVETDSPASTPKWGTLTFNSLLRRKKKRTNVSDSDSKASTLDKRTTIDRIKVRPPLELPIEDDVYEAMDETPPPVRKEKKKKAAKETAPKEEFKAFTQPKPKHAVPPPPNIGPVAPPINLQLKQAVEKRNRLNPVQQPPPGPSQPKPLPKTLPTPKALPPPKEPKRQNATLQPPIPKQKPWQNESPLPKAKVWPPEGQAPKTNAWSNDAHMPKQKKWQRELPSPEEQQMPDEQVPVGSRFNEAHMPKQKKWQRDTAPEEPQLPEEQVPVGSRFKVKPYNPGLPPPDAPPAKVRTPWGEAVPPKLRPPPPVKPKQLHPLPHPPCEPEPIPVVPDGGEGDSDDSEDWVYEPLPQYNIYSM